MAFNTLIYLFFLGFIACIYYISPGKWRWIWLLVASTGYYLSFIPVYLPVLLFIIIINFFLVRWQASSMVQNPRTIIPAIIINILILVFFKYFNFFFPGTEIHLYAADLFFRTTPINKLILPLGISYLIFTVLSYHIELKRATIVPEKNFGIFSLYLLFFPRIAQGPIERPQHLIPQLRQVHSFDPENITEGIKLLLWGYFKKLVIADRLAIYVNAVYDTPEHHNGTTLLLATFFYLFQIYADFSGYTDIALGSARIFGIRLTDNFRRPFLATSIKDFWSRWHITLSNWLRDYIFLPMAYFLSGKMKKAKYLKLATEKWIYFIAITVTFGICGLWHGEGWTFLVWGLLFGIFLTYSNWTEKLNRTLRKRLHINKNSSGYIFYKVFVTFFLVFFTMIFFRSDSLSTASVILKKMVTTHGMPFYESPANLIYATFGIFALMAVDIKKEYFKTSFSFLHNKSTSVRIGSMVTLVIIILLIGVFDGGQFIYFKF